MSPSHTGKMLSLFSARSPLFYMLGHTGQQKSWENPGLADVEACTARPVACSSHRACGQQGGSARGASVHPAALAQKQMLLCWEGLASSEGDTLPATKGALVTLCQLHTGHLSPYSMFLISTRGRGERNDSLKLGHRKEE